MPNTYTTKSGDVWDMIAYRELGSCNHVEALMNANRAYLDTAIFSAGVVLVLPEVSNERPSVLPPWRKRA